MDQSTSAPATKKVDPAGHIPVRLLSKDARMPTRGSLNAAGWDLYSSQAASIPANDRLLVRTDIAVAVPKGCYGRIAPRSGLALKHGIDVFAGVVDSDYRGAIGVVLYNSAKKVLKINKGDRIAQLIIEQINTRPLFEVDSLEETQRSGGGFGSTGVLHT